VKPEKHEDIYDTHRKNSHKALEFLVHFSARYIFYSMYKSTNRLRAIICRNPREVCVYSRKRERERETERKKHEKEESNSLLSQKACSVDTFGSWMADKAPLKPSFDRANNP